MLTEMGFTQAGTVWLQPEEALFLVESARLVLLHHGRKLSMQETHAAMVRTPRLGNLEVSIGTRAPSATLGHTQTKSPSVGTRTPPP
jgi:hypothetical protein